MTCSCRGWVPVLSLFSRLGHSHITAERCTTDKTSSCSHWTGESLKCARLSPRALQRAEHCDLNLKLWLLEDDLQEVQERLWLSRQFTGMVELNDLWREEGWVGKRGAWMPCLPLPSPWAVPALPAAPQLSHKFKLEGEKGRDWKKWGTYESYLQDLLIISFWNLRFKLMYSLAKSYSSFSGQVVIERNVIFLIKPEHLLPLGSAACNVPWGHGAFCNSYCNCNIWQKTFKNTVYKKSQIILLNCIYTAEHLSIKVLEVLLMK